ncbi:hypothetical protein [Aquibacillus kalidii]|uniref:hypothetical protein n=1 Tax=Aquibacillus kalidii TaxID=2762597 RepID=UPI001646362D|nr:hypothetical protein [Aquibacillus kalidii]
MSEKGIVINFNDYKRKKKGLDKPIFRKPTKISIGDLEHPEQNGQYLVICNLVHDNRQFLAMERQDEEEALLSLVEGIVEDGLLVRVAPIKADELPEIEAKFSKVFAQASTKYGIPAQSNRKKFNFRK